MLTLLMLLVMVLSVAFCRVGTAASTKEQVAKETAVAASTKEQAAKEIAAAASTKE